MTTDLAGGAVPPMGRDLTFGECLKGRMKEKGLTKKVLAEALKVTVPAVDNWLNNKGIRPGNLKALLEFLFHGELGEEEESLKNEMIRLADIDEIDKEKSNNAESLSEYAEVLKEEREIITSRLKGPALVSSDTRTLAYGWARTQPWYGGDLSPDKADPSDPCMVAFAYTKDFLNRMLVGEADDDWLCLLTIRFYAFAILLIIQPNGDDRQPPNHGDVINLYLDTLAELAGTAAAPASVLRYTAHIAANFHEAAKLLSRLEDQGTENSRQKPVELLRRSVELIAKALGATGRDITELVNQERARNKGSGKVKGKRDANDDDRANIIMTIYFVDGETMYMKIMNEIKGTISMNLIRTESETLMPDRVAKVTFWAHAREDVVHENMKKLRKRLKAKILGAWAQRLPG